MIREELIALHRNEILHECTTKPKLRFFREFKSDCLTEKYVTINLTSSERSVLSQLRFGILPLAVETGRFINQPLEQRLCKTCNVIEDEWHFIFDCELYNDERNMFFENICNQHRDFMYLDGPDQLSFLFKEKHRSFAKYIKSIWDKRHCSLFV